AGVGPPHPGPTELRFEVDLALPNGALFSAHYLKLAAAGPGVLFRDDPRSPLYLGAVLRPAALTPLAELALAARAPLGPLALAGAVRLDVSRADPRGDPATPGAGAPRLGPGVVSTDAALSWRARCGCFAATLRAAWSPGQPAPDVLLGVELAPLATPPG
ncbi:MAG TPA: hypothetical protein VG389_19740, partial [Myxococcota bacterium]|nr:hypothetical protein [Myxococcota bacterium]